MEGKMGEAIDVRQSRGYIIFEAFARHAYFKDALSDLENYEKNHPEKKIFLSAEERKGLQASFLVFRQAEIDASKHAPISYDEKETVENVCRLIHAAIHQDISEPKDDFSQYQGISIQKMIIGYELAAYASVAGRGLLEKAPNENTKRTPQVFVGSYRKLHKSYEDGKVFNDGHSVPAKERPKRKKRRKTKNIPGKTVPEYW